MKIFIIFRSVDVSRTQLESIQHFVDQEHLDETYVPNAGCPAASSEKIW